VRTSIATRDLLPEGLHPVRVWASSRASGARCPVCGRDSSRVHSRYSRNVSDPPWHGISVELEVRARRFFCEEASCERKIFWERVPDVAAHARKTDRLEEALLVIALELRCRAGARLAAELELLVGRDALLSRAGRAVPAVRARVLAA
jgi:transposase